ncbi:hypothetical protein CVS40_11218 [Lucilia cuprina]|nr:hypothetical protein CVS40_11218 [Lucilia cuprina]
MWQAERKQTLTPLKQILKISEQNRTQMPLNSLEKCRFKQCQTQAQNKCEHLTKLDKYWSELLKAQEESTANYLYNIQIFGNNQDKTLEKKQPVEEFEVQQRVMHLGFVGGLFKSDMFYLLSFLLNLLKLNEEKQMEYMEYLQDEKLLEREILDYLELLSGQKNVGLGEQQREDLVKMLEKLRERKGYTKERNYYNAEQIFLKSLNNINPYELEYLKNILHSTGKLTETEFWYLAKFVDKLQALEQSKREEYLNYFHKNKILPFKRFETLLAFMFSKSKRLKQNNLKNLLKALYELMDIQPCVIEMEKLPAIKPKPLAIHIDYQLIDKALRHLLKERLPNIVRVNDLKNFLCDLLVIHPDQIWENLLNLKKSNILTPSRFKYIENFILQGKLGKVDKMKRNLLLFLLKRVTTLTLNSQGPEGILTNLSIPASKGPLVERPQIEAVKTAEEPLKKEEQTKQEIKTPKEESKEKALKKLNKKVSKKSSKKGGKKKK